MAKRGKHADGLLTQQKMLRSAVALFLEKGYEKTTTAEIAAGAGMGQSTFFRAFPSKEILLLELVARMFDGQFAMAEQLSPTADPVLYYAMETALQLQIVELSEPLCELYVTAYTLPNTSDFIRRKMVGRLREAFGPFWPEAEEKDFYEMEIASGSIMRGFMAVPCDMYFTIDAKVSRFLDCALKLYDVSPQRRGEIIGAVLEMDLRAMARAIIQRTIQQAEEGFVEPPAQP